MAKQSINIGSAANDRTGDTLRAAGDKVNDNFDELYTALGNGSTLSAIATETYVDTAITNVINSAPEALDTLNELAAALGDDANFSTTISTALGNRLRVDVDNQGLNGTQQTNALTNLGITATTSELNILDGVTATAAELNILDGVTATASELNILDGVTADATELNVLDGITATTTELNYVDGVTSAIQTQLNDKADSSSLATVATSGDYTDLTNTPTIPADVSDLTDTTNLLDNSARYTFVSGDGTDYTVSGPGIDATNQLDPTLIVYRGHTYKFINTATGHPVEFLNSSDNSAITRIISSTGATANVAQVGETVTFTVPLDAATGNTYLYRCTAHPGAMLGTITVA